MENENLIQDKAVELEVEKDAEDATSASQDKPSVYERIISIFCLIVLIAGLAVFLLGATNAFGKSLNAFSVVTFIMNIFTIKLGKIYVCIAKLAIAIVYFIILGKFIKNLVQGSRLFGKISKKYSYKERWICVSRLYEQTANTISSFIFFMFFVYALSGDSFGTGTIFFIVISALLYLSVNVLNVIRSRIHSLKDKNAIVEFIFLLLRPVFFTFIIYLLATYILQPAVDNLSFGVQVIFGGHFGTGFSGVMETLYNFFVKDVCYIINMIAFYWLVRAICFDGGITEREKGLVNMVNNKLLAVCEMKVKSKSILIYTAITAVVNCVVMCLNASISSFGMETLINWLSVLKVYFIPVILLTVVVLLVSEGVFEQKA